MSFHVGQGVICVDDSINPNYGPHALKAGVVYVISKLIPTPGDEAPGIEIGGFYSFAMYGWRPERFRPIIERKTDISVFTKLLTPKKMEEVA